MTVGTGAAAAEVLTPAISVSAKATSGGAAGVRTQVGGTAALPEGGMGMMGPAGGSVRWELEATLAAVLVAAGGAVKWGPAVVATIAAMALLVAASRGMRRAAEPVAMTVAAALVVPASGAVR